MKQYKYRIENQDFDVTIKSLRGQKAEVLVNGMAFEVDMLSSELTEEQLPEMVAAENGAQTAVAAPAAKSEEAAPAAAPQGAGEGKAVNAPLPGVVTKVLVSVGQAVKKGETVVVLEAMKMENNITAECDGTVSGVAVKAGDSVMEGAVLVTIK